MRKILILSIVSLFTIVACKETTPKFEIQGEVIGEMDGKIVYLKKFENMRPAGVIDSAVITSGVFTMGGIIDTPDLYNISIKGERIGVNLFLEKGSINVTFDITKEDKDNSTVSGTPLNDSYAGYVKKVKSYNAKIQDIIKRAQEAEQSSPDNILSSEEDKKFQEEYDQITDSLKNYQLNFINEHPNTLVSALVLLSISNELELDELEAKLSKFDAIVGKSFLISTLKEQVEMTKKVSVGQEFIDVKLPNPEGVELALSDFAGKGKYVLIDFWASWCGPCRMENPNVVALYNKYKDRDFEIVGISADKSKDAWLKGIKDDKITWPQMSDLKGWESEAFRLYQIKGIPSTILLDKEGIIIAKNLRGEELAAKIAELLESK